VKRQRHDGRLHSDRRGKIGSCFGAFGYTQLESTVLYLGIEVDDALSISEQVELVSGANSGAGGLAR
jgi:hypothetical protein